MNEEWLIDGYNLLHALFPGSLQDKRNRNFQVMISWVADFASQENHKILMVLDGHGSQSELDIYHTAFFNMVYSQKISADAVIERRLYQGRSQTRFTVITNDRAISNIARGGGAVVLGVAHFVEMIKESKKTRDESAQKGKIKSHGFHRPFEDKLKHLE